MSYDIDRLNLHQKTALEHAPLKWRHCYKGQWVQAQLFSILANRLPQLVVTRLVKLGELSCQPLYPQDNIHVDPIDSKIKQCATISQFENSSLINSCQIPWQIGVSPTSQYADIQANLYTLPFISKSVSTVSCLHQLEYYQYPHLLLREIDRILQDDGVLILSGTTPFSFFAWQSYHWDKQQRQKNSSKGLFPPSYINDTQLNTWLSFLNYEIIDLFHCSPSKSSKTLWGPIQLEPRKSRFKLSYRQLHQQTIGGCYLLIAKKRTYPMRPILSDVRRFTPKLALAYNCDSC